MMHSTQKTSNKSGINAKGYIMCICFIAGFVLLIIDLLFIGAPHIVILPTTLVLWGVFVSLATPWRRLKK